MLGRCPSNAVWCRVCYPDMVDEYGDGIIKYDEFSNWWWVDEQRWNHVRPRPARSSPVSCPVVSARVDRVGYISSRLVCAGTWVGSLARVGSSRPVASASLTFH